MSLRFIDGFDHYPTASVAAKWAIISGPTIEQQGRFGGGNLLFNSIGNAVTTILDNQPTWVVGFAMRILATVGGVSTLVVLLDGGTAQCELIINADMTLGVRRTGAASPTGGTTAAPVFSLNTWAYVEWKVTIADSIAAGSCKVRVNGVNVIDVPAGNDFKVTANAFANQVRFGVGNPPVNARLDDLYVCDGVDSGIAGKPNNDFLGDVRVECLYPTGAGATTSWTPSTGANYTCVDETSVNADTDYVSSSTAGQVDSYALGDLSSTPAAVYGVQEVLTVRKDDAGSRSVAALVRSGGVDYPGATVSVGDSYNGQLSIWQGNPNGSTAWTQSSINALEAGAKLVS